MGSAVMLLLLAASLAFASASVASPPRGGEPNGRSSGNCPDKWVDATFVDMGCLYFNSTAGMSWDDANSLCQMGSNSTLLAIESEMQMAFIQMELQVIADHEGDKKHWWTAGTDAGIDGQWVWATTYTVVEDYVWGDGYPRNSQYPNYNCMMLHHSLDYLGFDTTCDSSRYPICQLKYIYQ